MYTVIRRGGVINASDVEGVRSVLADARGKFFQNAGICQRKESCRRGGETFAKRMQLGCAERTGSENGSRIYRSVYADCCQKPCRFYLYYRNQDAARAAAADFDNVMSDETYFRLERNSRLNQHLGIRNADFEIPEHYDLKKFLPRLTMSAVLQRISRFLSRGRRKSTGTIMKIPKTSAGRWPKTSKR